MQRRLIRTAAFTALIVIGGLVLTAKETQAGTRYEDAIIIDWETLEYECLGTPCNPGPCCEINGPD